MRRIHLTILWLGAAMHLGCDGLLTTPARSGGRVSVEATGRYGRPVPGVTAILYTGIRPMGYRTTDSDGRARFSELPDEVYGVYMYLTASLADSLWLPGTTISQVACCFSVTPMTDTAIRFDFYPDARGALDVTVVTDGGVPVAGRGLTLTRDGVRVQSRTDSLGLARLEGLPPGTYQVAAPSFREAPFPDSIRLSGQAIAPNTRSSLRLQLPPCHGTIRAAVRDQADAPVAGVRVTLYVGTVIVRRGITDATGTARWDRVSCERLGVFVTPPTGYSAPWARDTAFVDDLLIRNGTELEARLRVIRTR